MKHRRFLFLSVLVVALLVAYNPPTACQLPSARMEDASHKEDDVKQWRQALEQAISANDTERIRTLLVAGRIHKLNVRPLYGDSLLMVALVKHCHLAVLRLLLQAGGNIESLNFSYGLEPSTPLMIASAYGTLEAVRFLLEHGAKVNARNPQGKTAFVYTAQYRTVGAVPVLRLLLRHGANAQARDGAGATALILAAHAGQPATLRFLLAQGIPLEAQGKHAGPNGFKGTALMVSALESNLAALKELLRHHAKVNARDDEGATPLMYAVSNLIENPQVVSTLLRYGADVNAKDKSGGTVWSWADHSYSEGNWSNPEVDDLLYEAREKAIYGKRTK